MRSTLTPTALLAILFTSLAGAIGPDCVNGPLATNKICDRNASPPERAGALVAAMEDTEKLDNLVRYRIKRCLLKTLKLTDAASLEVLLALACQHTTGGEKLSTALLARLASTSLSPSPTQHLFQCLS